MSLIEIDIHFQGLIPTVGTAAPARDSARADTPDREPCPFWGVNNQQVLTEGSEQHPPAAGSPRQGSQPSPMGKPVHEDLRKTVPAQNKHNT